jgi:hypothetical protein
VSKDFGFRPPQRAIVEGASVPAGAAPGTFVWSSSANKILVWTGARWMAPVEPSVEEGYVEVVRTSGRVTSIIRWSDANKTRKIEETVVTRTEGWATKVVETAYNYTGTATDRVLSSTLTRGQDGRVTSTTGVKT